MLAYRAKFAGHPPAGPQEFHAVACAAFGADAFRRFFAETNGLDTLDSLFGITVTLFCLHCHFSTLKFVVGSPMGPALADIQKNLKPINVPPPTADASGGDAKMLAKIVQQ